MNEPERSHGWTLFATIVVGVAGAWNVMLGVAALVKKEYFHEGALLYQNLSFWGWVWIVVGGLQLLTAILIAARTTAGKALGLIGASVSMLVWFFSIGAHPLSTILVIALDVLVLYALTADRPYAGASSYPQARDRAAGPTYEPGRHFG
jgi:hypothetical protein